MLRAVQASTPTTDRLVKSHPDYINLANTISDLQSQLRAAKKEKMSMGKRQSMKLAVTKFKRGFGKPGSKKAALDDRDSGGGFDMAKIMEEPEPEPVPEPGEKRSSAFGFENPMRAAKGGAEGKKGTLRHWGRGKVSRTRYLERELRKRSATVTAPPKMFSPRGLQVSGSR